MGWLKRLVQKSGVAIIIRQEPENVHVYELEDWLRKQREERVAEHNLAQRAQNYMTSLVQKREQLEILAGKASSGLSFSLSSGQFAGLIRGMRELSKELPEQHPGMANLSAVIALHERLGPTIARLLRARESENHDAEKEVSLASAWEAGQSGGATDSREGTGSRESTLQFLWRSRLNDLGVLHEEFQEALRQSRAHNFLEAESLGGKIEENTDKLRVVREQLQSRKLRLEQARKMQSEKEEMLRLLQKNTRFVAFATLRAEREELLRKLQRSESFTERFNLREAVDALERKVGDKDFILKVEEALYRLEHFAEQAELLEKEHASLERKGEILEEERRRDAERLTALVKEFSGKEISVTFP